FSSADFARLYSAPVMDPVYGYQAVNVESDMRDPSSLLHWLQRMIQVRKQHPLFGIGSFEVVSGGNPSVLAFVRRNENDIVLCVNNLSRFPQPVELPLTQFNGKTPVELIGRVPFPKIGELPYLLTLGPYGHYWFQLT
ncbi:MAG: alpha-glucosidase C-terminal domain-containing protein, partial [Acidimicrobiia bacterium]